MTTRDEAVARLTAPGAPFEIHTEDVLGEPMEVFAHRHRSLSELLQRSRGFGDAEYLVTTERRLGFTEHLDEVAALAQALRVEHGVGKGDRVAICAANCPEWVVAFWATVSLGAVAVGMNSMWAGPELRHGLDLTEPRVLIADEPRRALAGEQSVPVLSIEADLPAIVARHRGTASDPTAVDEDDPAVVLFTSGTSGRPKGATHSHRNVLCALWYHLLNDAVAAEMGVPQSGRRFLLATPLFHIAALHNLAVIRLAVGDTAVIHLGRFDIDRVLRLVEAERVTNWGAVPTMLGRVVELGDRLGDYDLSSLRTLSVSSAPSSPELKVAVRRSLPQAARSFGTSYGLTEAAMAATVATAAELEADPDTVGRAVPTMQVEVRDDAGHVLPDGVEGEVCLRGPQMMLGYWRNPEATAASTAPHGWYRTGDLGTLRDGRLRISSRRSDLILRGGENVYPAEVEHVIAGHPAVHECAVVGVPDPDLGQAVAALVVLRPDARTEQEELCSHVIAAIARYKVPTRWVLSTEPLPRNATGKVDRSQLVLLADAWIG
ncbi:Long-chain-fatty-acid--CoA ligase FadD13 [Nocardioides dokdonensis FR1436]|uniref:Long-chain-fatty-acid--CoA ligase FadD13 n=1 Tax=Nocardioides dokdonensis FR1436 TaxID=1300347 RepID=A0A1A9GHC8_9ACTN|nr:class I adenylate-forming enzyme family protein [Nocardioides dokdonensis]ANH37042.1 Long-chain-fatty-acid--CoA ligase FadD13 [Nocardioides dokdonensis FR1436]